MPEGFDAYVVSTGTPTARDLKIPGRELKGVYFALELLSQQNRILGVVLLSAAAWLLSSVLLPHPANTLTAKTPAKILDNTLFFIK